MFFSLMGGIWIVIWSNRSFGSKPIYLTVIAACALLLFGFAWSKYQKNKAALVGNAESPEKKRADSIFNIVNAGQWILILIAGNVLVNIHQKEWVFAAAMFIIGLHFIPLASVFKYPVHYITGTALMVWAVGYSLALPMGPANPIGCLGTGIILWLSAIYGLTVKPFPE